MSEIVSGSFAATETHRVQGNVRVTLKEETTAVSFSPRRTDTEHKPLDFDRERRSFITLIGTNRNRSIAGDEN